MNMTNCCFNPETLQYSSSIIVHAYQWKNSFPGSGSASIVWSMALAEYHHNPAQNDWHMSMSWIEQDQASNLRGSSWMCGLSFNTFFSLIISPKTLFSPFSSQYRTNLF